MLIPIVAMTIPIVAIIFNGLQKVARMRLEEARNQGGATILEPDTDAEVLATWDVMRQLRPHLAREEYSRTVRRLMEAEGYRLAALVEDGQVRAVASYRFMEMLYCGRFLYLDDFVTDERERSRGYGRQLLDWLKATARSNGCRELHLDSRLHRGAAHRFYEREGVEKTCYHFAAVL